MNLNELKKKVNNTLVGEYLKGVASDKDYIPNNIKSEDLGLSVLGENFNGNLIKDNYYSPVVSCGGLNILIQNCNEKLTSMAERCNHVFGFQNLTKHNEFLERYTNDLLKAASPIAFAEGASDDELKQDIRILLRESKDEFEKRVEANEKEKAEEKEANLADNTDEVSDEDVENASDGLEDANSEGMISNEEDLTSDEGNEFTEDSENAENADENEDNELVDGDSVEDEDDIPSGNFEGYEDDIDNPTADEEDEDKKEGKGESFIGVRPKKGQGLPPYTQEMLDNYNRQVNHAEEEKYYYKGVGEFCSITKGEMKNLVNELLDIEKDNFKAIGESFDIKLINSNSGISLAHRKFVNTNAAILAFKRKLNR